MAYKRIKDLSSELKSAAIGPVGLDDLPDAPILQALLTEEADRLDAEVRVSPSMSPDQRAKAQENIQQARTKFREVNVGAGDQAKAQLIGILQQHLSPVSQMLDGTQAQVPGGRGPLRKE